MTPQEFAEQWFKREVEAGFQISSNVLIAYSGNMSFLDSETAKFLTEAGLPNSAAPCLGFKETKKLQRIWELYSQGQWNEDKKLPLRSYRVLGLDGAGNPICLNEETREVWLLDHEDHFCTATFVNTSVLKLAECLLANHGQESGVRLKKEIERIDPPALQNGTFWAAEITMLIEENG